LVGKTTAGSGNAGVQLEAGGRGGFTKDGAYVTFQNRLSSDGEVSRFMRDGTKVGSIDSRGGIALTLNSESGNGRLAQGGTAYYEWNTTRLSPVTDTVGDLGRSVQRWKDLYLSGGVYVGGTTSANYLDDYEEGTWTPAYTFSSSQATITYLAQAGHYAKVGDLVTFSFTLQTSAFSGGSGYMWVSGLPFTGASAGGHAGGGFLNYARSWPSNHNFGKFSVGDSSTVVTIYVQNHDATSPTYLYPSDFSNGANNNYLQVSGLYRAS